MNPVELMKNRSVNYDLTSERMVLGALLLFGKEAKDVFAFLAHSDFHDKLHMKLFSAIKMQICKGGDADATLIFASFVNDEAFLEKGGIRYLATLIDQAPDIISAAEHALAVYVLSLRRKLAISDLMFETTVSELLSAAERKRGTGPLLLSLAAEVSYIWDDVMGGVYDPRKDLPAIQLPHSSDRVRAKAIARVISSKNNAFRVDG